MHELGTLVRGPSLFHPTLFYYISTVGFGYINWQYRLRKCSPRAETRKDVATISIRRFWWPGDQNRRPPIGLKLPTKGRLRAHVVVMKGLPSGRNDASCRRTPFTQSLGANLQRSLVGRPGPSASTLDTDDCTGKHGTKSPPSTVEPCVRSKRRSCLALATDERQLMWQATAMAAQIETRSRLVAGGTPRRPRRRRDEYPSFFSGFFLFIWSCRLGQEGEAMRCA